MIRVVTPMYGVRHFSLWALVSRHFDARSPVFSAPKGPNIPAQGIALGLYQGDGLALKGRNRQMFRPFRACVDAGL